VKTTDLLIDGDGSATRTVGILANTAGAGNTAGIQISASTVTVHGGGQIKSESDGPGAAGPINITASGSIVVSGSPTLLDSSGNPQLDSNGNPIHKGSGINSFSEPDLEGHTGAGGDISVVAPGLRIEDGGRIDSSGYGRVGNISAKVGLLEIQGQTQNRGDSTYIGVQDYGSYAAGTVRIDASKSIVVNGTATVPRFFGAEVANPTPDGIFNDTYSSGNAGAIVIHSPKLVMSGGALVRAGSGANFITGAPVIVTGNAGSVNLETDELELRTGARIETHTTSNGHAGDINIRSNSILISGSGTLPDGKASSSGIFSDTFGQGAGGTVIIRAGNINILDGGAISAESHVGTGDAGRIELAVGAGLLLRDSSITTASDEAGGGSIDIHSTGSGPTLAHLVNSTIATSVGGGQGDAGNITIGEAGNPLPLTVVDRSQIRANAIAGAGGHIVVRSNVFLESPDSIISASAGAQGINGTVDIQSSVSQLSQNFLPLRVEFLPDLMSIRCGGAAKRSTLVMAAPQRSRLSFPFAFEADPNATPTSPSCGSSHNPLHILWR
jgi:hypothetical protein